MSTKTSNHTTTNARVMAAIHTTFDISLYRHEIQEKTGSINGYELFKHLSATNKILGREDVLENWLAGKARHGNMVPEWHGFELYVWGDIKEETLMPTGQQVTYFFYKDRTWQKSKKWIGEKFSFNHPAVIIEEDEDD